jgi:serine protease DegS
VRNEARFSYSPAVSKAAPSVVSIRTATPSHTSQGKDSVALGVGSGVVFHPDGIIVTNYHVIREAQAIAVETRDGQTWRADVVGFDYPTDLAVLKVDRRDLPAIPRAPSAPRVGDVVLAIGFPVFLSQTVTVGIVSATERLERGFIRLLQTDAAINRGNSGGALINASGEWIGINSEVLPSQIGIQGIGFAIPADYVTRIVEDILQHGRVIRGSIGFVGTGTLNEIRSDNGAEKPLLNAVKVDRVDAGGAAAQGGVLPGDRITHFNGHLIGGVTDLLTRIAESKPGTRIHLRVTRGEQVLELPITVGERPPDVPPPVKPRDSRS